LSFANPKPMEKYGDEWENHYEKIRVNWLNIVNETDIVLVLGDISWALKYINALLDMKFISELLRKKIFIKGNHDFWWK
jgi:predicted phosphohydrolase